MKNCPILNSSESDRAEGNGTGHFWCIERQANPGLVVEQVRVGIPKQAQCQRLRCSYPNPPTKTRTRKRHSMKAKSPLTETLKNKVNRVKPVKSVRASNMKIRKARLYKAQICQLID